MPRAGWWSAAGCGWPAGPVSSTDAALVDVVLHGGHDQAHAELARPRRSRNSMTSAKLWPVSTCITGNGNRAGRERLLREAQHDDRVLAAGEQQHRPLELGGHLADDVDGLGLEGPQVGELVGRDRHGTITVNPDQTGKQSPWPPPSPSPPTTPSRRGRRPRRDGSSSRSGPTWPAPPAGTWATRATSRPTTSSWTCCAPRPRATPSSPRRAADDLRRLQHARVWIIDPLDGTREFGEAGRSDWAVHVALCIDGVAVAGAVALPALGPDPRHPARARAPGAGGMARSASSYPAAGRPTSPG